MKRVNNVTPLIVEPHPQQYDGYDFLTLIQYSKTNLLTAIDEVDDRNVHVYVFDLCGPENVKHLEILNILSELYPLTIEKKQPLSVIISQRGYIDLFAPIHRTLNLDFISRVVGPFPKYIETNKSTTKRRKRKDIPHYLLTNKKTF